MQYSAIAPSWHFLWQGTLTTIELSLLSLLFGCTLGVLLALLATLGHPTVRLALRVLVNSIRGIPLLIQLLVVYLGTQAVGVPLDPFPAAVIGLSINASAYVSEIVRGGIASVAKGQREAGLAIGLSAPYVWGAIILPQALPSIVPAMMGFFISLVKDTSLAYVVGLLELMRTAKAVADDTMLPFEVYTVVAAIYFVLCFPLSLLTREVDRRLQRSGLAQRHL